MVYQHFIYYINKYQLYHSYYGLYYNHKLAEDYILTLYFI